MGWERTNSLIIGDKTTDLILFDLQFWINHINPHPMNILTFASPIWGYSICQRNGGLNKGFHLRFFFLLYDVVDATC
jgi:hypothetical protein